MNFDAQAATAAYIDSLGPEALQKAAAYTSGGHWLLLFGLLVAVAVSWIFVRAGVLEKVEARLQKRGPVARTFLVSAAFFLFSAILTLPWDIYTEWFRETAYGRTTQPLGDYLLQGSIALVINALLGGIFFVAVYALIRRAGKRWWLWTGGLTAVMMAIFLLVSPVVFEPLFNDYKPLPQGEVRDALEKQAKDANIPADRIFSFDASRQTTNFTANVSGLGGSARIAIADNALKGGSLDEVKAVTGHEIGHYVLNHVARLVFVLAFLLMLFFYIADLIFPAVARWLGSTATISEVRGLPVLVLIVTVLSFVAKPLTNAVIRMNETEADQYSLRAVNLPDAMAGGLVKTAEYRDPRPHPLQEALFYSHPSVERRVAAAMAWKAGHGVEPKEAAAKDK